MKRFLPYLALLISASALAELADGHVEGGRSPKGTYLIDTSRDPDKRENSISIARQDHSRDFFPIYSYPRLSDLYFSPDEKRLVINDHSGSGSTECIVLTQIKKPPYFAKPQKIDETCWKLFWSLHRKPNRILYDHRSAYFCQWLDASRIIVGLGGDHFFPDPGAQKWSLGEGWHCIYDLARDKAYTSKFTDSKNKYEFKIE